MNGKWTFNEQDDGCWNHDDYATKEEAINAAREHLCDDQPVMYVGQCKTVPLPTYVDVDFMFEQLNERHAEECFEYDDFLFDGISEEDRKWLEKRLEGLVAEFYKRTGIESHQFVMENIEKVRWEK